MSHNQIFYIKYIFILIYLIIIFESKIFGKNFELLNEYKKIEKYLKVCNNNKLINRKKFKKTQFIIGKNIY